MSLATLQRMCDNDDVWSWGGSGCLKREKQSCSDAQGPHIIQPPPGHSTSSPYIIEAAVASRHGMAGGVRSMGQRHDFCHTSMVPDSSTPTQSSVVAVMSPRQGQPSWMMQLSHSQRSDRCLGGPSKTRGRIGGPSYIVEGCCYCVLQSGVCNRFLMSVRLLLPLPCLSLQRCAIPWLRVLNMKQIQAACDIRGPARAAGPAT
jgi:hypothetical protein